MWAVDILECYQQSLMGDSSQSWEDQNADREIDSTDQDQEVQLETKGPVGVGTKGHVFYSQEGYLSTFCICHNILQETDIKGCVLINLVGKISRYSKTEAVVGVRLVACSQFTVRIKGKRQSRKI